MSQAEYGLYLARRHPKDDPPSGAVPTGEAKLHQQIIDLCAGMGWVAVHSRMDRATTQAKGVPDFAIIAQGKTTWIEVKSAKGKRTTEQLGFAAQAEKNNVKVHVVRHIDEFLDAVAVAGGDA